MKFYFLGEFGYVFRQLLPFLEQCDKVITLLTWKTTCQLIDLLWPSKFNLISAEDCDISFNGANRDCIHLRDVNIIKTLEQDGFLHISALDGSRNFFSDMGWVVFRSLSEKIQYGEQLEDKTFASIFPRNRKIAEGKNNVSGFHVFWIKQNHPDLKIMGHGVPDERLDLNIPYCDDIYQQINILNNSKFFISPPSGMVDLALFCGCDVILTGDYKNIEKSNPHNCKISKWENVV